MHPLLTHFFKGIGPTILAWHFQRAEFWVPTSFTYFAAIQVRVRQTVCSQMALNLEEWIVSILVGFLREDNIPSK